MRNIIYIVCRVPLAYVDRVYSRRLLLIQSIGLFAIFTSTVSAQVVECIDASGNKSYSDNCPSGTVKQKEIMKGGTSAPPDGTAQTQESYYRNQDAEFRRQKIEQEEAEAKNAAKEKEKCTSEALRLANMTDSRRVGVIDPVTYERKILSDDERVAEIAKTKDWIDSNCKK